MKFQNRVIIPLTMILTFTFCISQSALVYSQETADPRATGNLCPECIEIEEAPDLLHIILKAGASNGEVLLTWVIDNADSRAAFFIEKKSGADFLTIGVVESDGSTIYDFIDANMKGKKATYRIKAVNASRSVVLSNEAGVFLSGKPSK